MRGESSGWRRRTIWFIIFNLQGIHLLYFLCTQIKFKCHKIAKWRTNTFFDFEFWLLYWLLNYWNTKNIHFTWSICSCATARQQPRSTHYHSMHASLMLCVRRYNLCSTYCWFWWVSAPIKAIHDVNQTKFCIVQIQLLWLKKWVELISIWVVSSLSQVWISLINIF